MLKKSVLFLIGLLLTATAWAASAPLLVIDALNEPGLPINFRATSDILPAGTVINTEGLVSLHAIGSAQYAEDGLLAVIDKIKAPIIVVDLRQESHGFVAGNAISWYGPRDWANLGKSPAQVETDQQYRLDALVQKEKISINKITDKNTEGQVTKIKPTIFAVNNVMSELEMTKLHHVGYSRIYVTDRMPPTDVQIDRFIQLIRSVPKDTWMYFHCRAGKGRTTSFMSMYDMMRNAKKVSFEDILMRQHLLGGIDLAETPAKANYKYSLQTERLELLKNFYQYCKTNQDDFTTSWSTWKKANNIVKNKNMEQPVSISKN